MAAQGQEEVQAPQPIAAAAPHLAAQGQEEEDDLPMAPPEDGPTTASPQEGRPAQGEEEEPPSAPPEEALALTLEPGMEGEVGLQLVKEVYAGSYTLGADKAMDAVRALHPHWGKMGVDSDLGRRVRWIRETNDWVYGELRADSFAQLLACAAPEPGAETFVDLGCGTGKVAALASLHFARVLGIELQAELHAVAWQLARDFRTRASACGLTLGEISISRADFLESMTAPWRSAEGMPWWKLADVAYACSPKFCEATMAALSEKAAEMKSGARFVTVRHRLQSPWLEEICRAPATFSWGTDDLIVHRRQ